MSSMSTSDSRGTPANTVEERIRYRTTDGFDLVGLRASPASCKAWVLMMHGITESKNEYGGFYKDLARALNSKGLGTLRFDFRGHGESAGTSMDISVLGDVLDVEATLAQLPAASAGRLAFIGTSFGAGPAILAAHSRRSSIQCLTLIAPVLDYTRTFLEPETEWAREWFGAKAQDGVRSSGHFMLESFRLSPRLLEEFRYLRPVEFLRESAIPTLIIHGNRDSMVPYGVSLEAAALGPPVALHTLKDADHGYTHFEDEAGIGPKSLELKRELIDEAVRFVVNKVS